MKISASSIEIMSPAGSFESLMAAIQGGAGSVYFGAGKLNMRARSAQNFSASDLKEIADICRRHKVKSYLALNTIVYDHELDEARQMIDLAVSSGITAIIASDMAVLEYCKKAGIETHISTQCNITNTETVRFYSQYADVMVLARELTLEQVKHIHRRIEEENITGPSGENVKLEIFVHGALCMAVSGKCYLSLDNENHSANRGDCLQLCRRKYIVSDKETGTQLEIDREYIMSPKDLCTIGFLDKILAAGVKVLKIEGRGRSPEYVKTVTQCYHEAVESIEQNQYSPEKIKYWIKQLEKVYNRGFWDGYYLGQKLGEWNEGYGSKSTQTKTYIGRITNYFPKIGVAEMRLDTYELSTGDSVLIIGPTTGVEEIQVQSLHTDNGPVITAVKNEACAFPVIRQVRKGDKVYKLQEKKSD